MLKNFINNITAFADMLPTQIIGIKNLQSQYVYCSPNFVKLFGSSIEEIVGKHDMFSDENTLRINEDQQIIKTQKALPFIHFEKINNKLTALTFIKSPIIDPHSSQVIGILCQVFDFAALDPAKQILNMYSNLQLTKQNNQELPQLTKREKQIIFLFLANLNSVEITEVIFRMENKKISKGSIDGVFTDQLFPKFKVYNRQALYARLIELGFNRLIPSEMLAKHTIALDVQSIY